MKTARISSDYYSENQTRYVFIDGSCCRYMEECYTTLRRQLSLPDYFGNNLDALEEVLADLEWIKEEKIKVIFLHVASLLNAQPDKKAALLDIFNGAENEKLELVYLQ